MKWVRWVLTTAAVTLVVVVVPCVGMWLASTYAELRIRDRAVTASLDECVAKRTLLEGLAERCATRSQRLADLLGECGGNLLDCEEEERR